MLLNEWKEQLLEQPDLPQIVQDLQKALEQEHQKRLSFYEWVTEDIKAEFINGQIIENSPVTDGHSEAVSLLHGLSLYYVNSHEFGTVKSEKAMVSLTRNDYEPDIVFWNKITADTFTTTQTHYPAPNWVVEVLSKGTEKRDRGIKFKDYASHGVTEYWIIDTRKKLVEQYVLTKNTKEYELFKKLGLGDDIESQAIKGFKIPVEAIFDRKKNLEVLKKILSEH